MTTDRVVLGVDFGTSFAKAILATEDGAIVARASVPQRVDRAPGGVAEQDPSAWWRDLGVLVARTLTEASRHRDLALAGIAISGHLPTLVLADDDGRPLAPAMLYADRRADAFISRACVLSGQALGGDEILPKLLWLSEHDPAHLRAARRLFNLQDWLGHRMTGQRALDHRTAMRSGLFDPEAMAWRGDTAAALGLDPGALPPVRRGGDVAGHVLPAVAAELGVPAGTPVLVGLGDTPATLVGAGVVHAGDAMVYYGTTTTLDVCTHDFASYLEDPRPIRDWAPYREVAYAVLGPAIRWASNGLRPVDDAGAGSLTSADLATLDDAAAALPPDLDAPFVIPSFEAHVAGGGHDPSVIVGLQPTHGLPHLHRAMLESFAFTARAGLEASGLAASTRQFVAAGGGARSAFWRQIVTDTLGAPQTWAPRADAALGDAMLAARATLGSDVLGAALPDWLGDVEVTVPDPARAAIQDRRYATWLATRASIAAVPGTGSA
jgi:xylulokinase